MKKYCTKCGREFEATGREVICPACKAAAAEDAKRAAVLRAKKASWAGESVPVRISGRASTIIREYAAEKCLSFAAALDALLKASDYFASTGKAWEEVEPYKSRRRSKSTTEDETGKQDAPQGKQDAPQEVKATSSKASASKTAGKAVKTTSKAAGKAGK